MKKGLWIVKFAAFGVLAVGLFGWATMLLWNWLVPVLFAGPVITFWQALGLLVLSKMLFWTMGRGGHGGHWRQNRWRHHYWSQKWSGMTPEEREQFKQKMKDKWCDKEPENTSAKDSGTSIV